MKARELYKAMMKATQAFGLNFYDLDLITVTVRQKEFVFTYLKEEFVVPFE